MRFRWWFSPLFRALDPPYRWPLAQAIGAVFAASRSRCTPLPCAFRCVHGRPRQAAQCGSLSAPDHPGAGLHLRAACLDLLSAPAHSRLAALRFCSAMARWQFSASAVTMAPWSVSSLSNLGTAVISFDLASVATCASTSRCRQPQAETICNGDLPLARSNERRSTLPSRATTPCRCSENCAMNR